MRAHRVAPRRLVAALALALLGAGQAQAGLFDDEEARKQIADFKAHTESRFDQQGKAQLDLVNQLQKLSEEIASLRGQVETLNYELETAKKRQQDFYVDLDTRVRKFEPQAANANVSPDGQAQTPAKPAGDPAAEGQAYEAALNHFKAGRYKEASWGFSSFVQKFPDSDLAPNAQFWLGNAFYALRDCRKAIEVQSVLTTKWPNSTKVPDAYVAIATCQQEMGNPAAAKRNLETVIAKYPDSQAAQTARQRLKGK